MINIFDWRSRIGLKIIDWSLDSLFSISLNAVWLSIVTKYSSVFEPRNQTTWTDREAIFFRAHCTSNCHSNDDDVSVCLANEARYEIIRCIPLNITKPWEL